MELSTRKGLYFGQTSAIITIIGLIMGLFSGTNSLSAIIGGILIISFADSLSDSFGMHLSEEAGEKGKEHVWKTMGYTFLSKLIFSLSFLLFFLIFDIWNAVFWSLAWGFFLLGLSSFYLAKTQKKNALKVVFEHIFMGIIVVVSTYLIGVWVRLLF